MGVVELVSQLPPEECEARLRDATDRDGMASQFGSKSAIGRVDGRSVRLRKRIGYRNSFQTILTGRLEGRDDGTVFRGKSGMSRSTIILIPVYFSAVGLAGGTLSAIAVGKMFGIDFGRPMEGNMLLPLGAVIFLILLAFGVGLVRYSRWLARDEGEFLAEFVAKTISARPAKDDDDRNGGIGRG